MPTLPDQATMPAESALSGSPKRRRPPGVCSAPIMRLFEVRVRVIGLANIQYLNESLRQWFSRRFSDTAERKVRNQERNSLSVYHPEPDFPDYKGVHEASQSHRCNGIRGPAVRSMEPNPRTARAS